MKTILTFIYNEEDNEDDLNRRVNSRGAYSALYEITSYLQAQYKYNEKLSEDTVEFVEKLREKILDIMDDAGVNLDRDFS